MIYLCPGYHSPQLTESFIRAIWHHYPRDLIVFPSDRLPPYSPRAITQYLHQTLPPNSSPPITWIGFSAGVVGGIFAARQWQQQGNTVEKFIAMDGWGIPLGRGFPVYRLDHDAWTYHSQQFMNGFINAASGNFAGDSPVAHFIADPAVDHLHLWRSPDQTPGHLSSPPTSTQCTAAECIRTWLSH